MDMKRHGHEFTSWQQPARSTTFTVNMLWKYKPPIHLFPLCGVNVQRIDTGGCSIKWQTHLLVVVIVDEILLEWLRS